MITLPSLARVSRALISAFAIVAAASPAAAQDAYPSKPVRIVVPFAAGGPADVYARILALRLQETMGQPFVVDDRPGAGSIIGTDAVAKSAPDGYTLLLMSNAHTVNESLIANKPFQLMRDFVPIAPINSSDLVLVARSGLPVSTLQELIAAAKAKPGAMTYASSGPGTPYHMAGELFKAMAGVSILHIPYKGSSGARTDVLGDQVDMMFDAVTTMTEHVRQGKVKALGTTGKTRSEVMPEVPTIAEAGVPGYAAPTWSGVIAPAGVPRPIIEKLNAAINTAIQSPTFRERFAAIGDEPAGGTPEEFAELIRADSAKWGEVVRRSGARLD